MRASGRAVSVVARVFVAVLASAAASSVGCSGGSAATTYCVFENGALQPGACLMECESRCALAARAGCGTGASDAGEEPPECLTECRAAEALESSACRDADYAYWRCLRLGGGPQVTCDGRIPVFTPDAAVCVSERAARADACGSRDGGKDADARVTSD